MQHKQGFTLVQPQNRAIRSIDFAWRAITRGQVTNHSFRGICKDIDQKNS